jgi:hypothetical protein
MSNKWDGTHFFIWQVDQTCGGNVTAMINQAKDLGVTGVIIKFANGSLNGDPKSQAYMDKFKAVVPAFKSAGFVVGGWIYQYMTDVQGEVDACFQAVEAGADWIVLDGEVELQGKNAQVQQFGQLFRAKYPDYPLAISSFAIADYHPEVPFNEYNSFVNLMMPQIYWADMGWDTAVAFNASIASYKKFGKPILPTGQSYDKATPTDMVRFVQLVNGAGLTHLSWWDWQEALPGHLQAIKENLIIPQGDHPVQATITKDSAEKVIYLLGDLYAASADPGVQAAAHYAADALRDKVGIQKN